MRFIIAAIGRLKKGPEQDLVARYSDRIKKSGKAIGITALETIEITESRGSSSQQRKDDEEESLLSRLPQDCFLIAFDERGKCPTSREFATTLETTLNDGAQNIALIIGGPDGLSRSLRQKADHIVSFGSLTMPHQLVRILVLEQLYRSITILTNHPYHRD
ncbi:MAG: 23S rRNA (pseudouridine(1915)-N(3))-methyltransferase RlmH [Rhizobiaceae bacterium]